MEIKTPICVICGTRTLGARIGSGCQGFYKKATWAVLSRHSEESFEYNYKIRMKTIMDVFCEHYDHLLSQSGNVKKAWNKSFHRQFFPSVYDFYKGKGYVSKKQLNLVENYLQDLDFLTDAIKETNKNKKEYFKNFQKKFDEEIINLTKTFYLEKNGSK